MPSQWSDDGFLEELRRHRDPLADRCVEELARQRPGDNQAWLFREMSHGAATLPAGAPPAIGEFFARTLETPPGLERARIGRGSRLFLTHAFPAATVLLTKSLVEGYAAPPLSRVLVLTGGLTRNPYRRLLGVLQMLVNVSAGDGFHAHGGAVVTAAKLRLLHAGIRRIVANRLPGYGESFGEPVNLEDMLGTIMGFSYLVLEGLKRLGIEISSEDAEAYYYLWTVFARLMGIHPPGAPEDASWVPGDLAAAGEFYRAYARRHYVEAAENPEGIELASANLGMLDRLLPRTPLRRLGFKIVPRIYCELLAGREACRRVGIRPVPLLFLTKGLLLAAPALWARLWGLLDRLDRRGTTHELLSRTFFERLIRRGTGGEVEFLVPADLADLRELS